MNAVFSGYNFLQMGCEIQVFVIFRQGIVYCIALRFRALTKLLVNVVVVLSSKLR